MTRPKHALTCAAGFGWMKDAEFDFERMQAAAQSGFMNAWAAATYLVKRGVPSDWPTSSGQGGEICLERNCELQDVRLEDLRGIHPAFDQDITSRL